MHMCEDKLPEHNCEQKLNTDTYYSFENWLMNSMFKVLDGILKEGFLTYCLKYLSHVLILQQEINVYYRLHLLTNGIGK